MDHKELAKNVYTVFKKNHATIEALLMRLLEDSVESSLTSNGEFDAATMTKIYFGITVELARISLSAGILDVPANISDALVKESLAYIKKSVLHQKKQDEMMEEPT